MNFKLYTLKQKNQKLFFLFKISIFLFIILIFDKSVGSTLNYFYFQQKAGLQYRTTYSMGITKADILIFGTSRANHHYHPDVFEKKLNLSFYNTGRDGTSILYHYAVLKSILNRYKPKLIILDFNAGEFGVNNYSYERLDALLPYYNTNTEIRSIVELRGPLERFKLLSSIYPYNSSILTIAFGNMKFTQKKLQDNKGYIALYKKVKIPYKVSSFNNNYSIDSIKLQKYQNFIEDCKKANVKLLIICSPYLINQEIEDYSLFLAKKIAQVSNVDFLDFSRDKYFNENPNLFQDYGHLNDDGARIFSEMLIDSLNKR